MPYNRTCHALRYTRTVPIAYKVRFLGKTNVTIDVPIVRYRVYTFSDVSQKGNLHTYFTLLYVDSSLLRQWPVSWSLRILLHYTDYEYIQYKCLLFGTSWDM